MTVHICNEKRFYKKYYVTSSLSLTHLCEIIEFLFIVLGAREIRIEVQILPGFS